MNGSRYTAFALAHSVSQDQLGKESRFLCLLPPALGEIDYANRRLVTTLHSMHREYTVRSLRVHCGDSDERQSAGRGAQVEVVTQVLGTIARALLLNFLSALRDREGGENLLCPSRFFQLLPLAGR